MRSWNVVRSTRIEVKNSKKIARLCEYIRLEICFKDWQVTFFLVDVGDEKSEAVEKVEEEEVGEI